MLLIQLFPLALGPITSTVNIMRYLQPCEVAQALQLLKEGSSVHLVARKFRVSTILSLVIGGDVDKLASTLGELGKGTEGPQHTNRTGISFCLLGNSDEALPVPYTVISSVALRYRLLRKLSETDSTAMSQVFDVILLTWSSHPVIVKPGGRLPENTKIGNFAIGAMCFIQMKVSST